MEDREIVELYHMRSENAITQTAEKYGRYCHAIAYHILDVDADAEECVSDTYLSAWNVMPPERPTVLSAFLGRITRNLAFNRYKALHAAKRGGGELPLVIEELSECVAGRDTAHNAVEMTELMAAINAFLKALPADKRCLFVRRYWYADSLAELAAYSGMREGALAVALHRLREKLRRHLEERGYAV